jgi:CHASE2 domain-containing sensor protein
LAALGLSFFRAFELYELQTYDWRCQIRGERPTSPEIVLIDIWDDTVEVFGSWPFDREYQRYRQAYEEDRQVLMARHGLDS